MKNIEVNPAKDYLSQISGLERQINHYLAEIEQLDTLATKVTGSIKNDKVQTSVEQQKMERAVVQLVDYKNEVARFVADYVRNKRIVENQIRGMDNEVYRDLLHARYIEHKTFELIAVDMNYSWRHVIRLHGAALEAFKEKYL